METNHQELTVLDLWVLFGFLGSGLVFGFYVLHLLSCAHLSPGFGCKFLDRARTREIWKVGDYALFEVSHFYSIPLTSSSTCSLYDCSISGA